MSDGLLWVLSRGKTYVITNAVTEDNDGGKLGRAMAGLRTRYECTKDETGRNRNDFHLGKWDGRSESLQATPTI